AAHALEEQRVVGVLQYAAVPLLLDVLQVFASGAAGRIVLAHVAEASGELREPLAVGALTLPLHGQVLGPGKRRAREHGDFRLVEEARRGGRGSGHVRIGVGGCGGKLVLVEAEKQIPRFARPSRTAEVHAPRFARGDANCYGPSASSSNSRRLRAYARSRSTRFNTARDWAGNGSSCGSYFTFSIACAPGSGILAP